ncbi:hypothetical protein K0504_09595 [Neiella marina]|uniref:Uncharacterized protein n=1 Tax=Neiella holothuriorum TaxID=2870530 RepID=A0ABS7EG26_9GAMM|nr:hypothetical protein [Neiella holothuriorum]MBW8191289.1 hypothetical protein [Neiella holothuriorum]
MKLIVAFFFACVGMWVAFTYPEIAALILQKTMEYGGKAIQLVMQTIESFK